MRCHKDIHRDSWPELFDFKKDVLDRISYFTWTINLSSFELIDTIVFTIIVTITCVNASSQCQRVLIDTFIPFAIIMQILKNMPFKGFRVTERNFAKRRIFESTDVSAGMGKAKSRHDMNTAGVRVEIISLCKSTDLFSINTVS